MDECMKSEQIPAKMLFDRITKFYNGLAYGSSGVYSPAYPNRTIHPID